MKILKHHGNYLEERAKFNRNIAIISFLLGIMGVIYFYTSVFSENFLTFGGFIILYLIPYFSIFMLGVSFFTFRNYSNYKKGLDGEKRVIEHLSSLEDDYYLINDLKLPESYGNIDHIILGPNGIFVIETKNFEGKIRCVEDVWYQYKDIWKIPEEHEIKSPSKQVKGNALKLKQFIESKNVFSKSLRLWVDGIVVFTNPNTNLELNNPTVLVLKIEELYNYIKNKRSKIKFSSKELELIGKAILRQIETN